MRDPAIPGRGVFRTACAAGLIAIVAFIGACSTAPRAGSDKARPPEPKAEEYVVQADQLLKTGREDEAIAVLSRAIEQNPTLTVAHMAMADIYRTKGDYSAAEKSYATAANLEPRNFDAQYYHGLMLHLLDRVREAIGAYIKALMIRPDDFQANLNLATAYLQVDGPQQSLPYAQRAVQLKPDSGPAHANLGAVYSALGQYKNAVSEYQSASELMQLTPQLLLNLAEALGKLERYQEMINTLDAAIRLQPSAAAYERVGFAYFRLRQYEQAVAAFRKSLEADGSHYPALNGLGVCLLNKYLLSDKTDEASLDAAMVYLRKSLRINNHQPRIVELVSRYGR